MTANPGETESAFEIRPLLEQRLTYPAELAEVRERLGTMVLAAPGPDESMTIGEVLQRDLTAETFDSADDLFLAICNVLPERYVGRTCQSERGTLIDDRHEPAAEREPRSF